MYSEIIGKTLTEAKDYLEKNGMTLRVSVKDKKHLMVTCDARANRVNVSVENDIVVTITGIG